MGKIVTHRIIRKVNKFNEGDFLRKFLRELLISASSGCLSRLIILALVMGGVGYAGVKYIVPCGDILKDLMLLSYCFAICLFPWVFRDLSTILNWFSERKESTIKELELKKEILELELEKNRQNSKSSSEEEEKT